MTPPIPLPPPTAAQSSVLLDLGSVVVDVDRMRLALSLRRQSARPHETRASLLVHPDPAVRELGAEVVSLEADYQTARTKLREAQRRLADLVAPSGPPEDDKQVTVADLAEGYARRAALVARARAAGLTHAQIGAHLGLSKQWSKQVLRRHAADLAPPVTDPDTTEEF